jgi:hypothetical protein
MRLFRRLLVTAPLALIITIFLTQPAAADNCDIFINPEDCQNTGWTVGVIATLAGGVAVATAATLASKRPPPPPPPSEDTTIHGVGMRAMYTNPTTATQPSDGVVRAHSMRIVAHGDKGLQTIREGRREPD